MTPEDLKEKRQRELQERMVQQQALQQKQLQAEMELDSLLRNILAPEAKQRLSNIRLVNQELYLTVAKSLLYLAKSGRLQGKISDAQLKQLLTKLQGEKKEIKIRRK